MAISICTVKIKKEFSLVASNYYSGKTFLTLPCCHMDTSYGCMHESVGHDLIALVVETNEEAAIVADDNGVALVDNSIRFDYVHSPEINNFNIRQQFLPLNPTIMN